MARQHHQQGLADRKADEGSLEPTPEEIFGPQVPPPMVELHAGPTSVWFDRDLGFLRRFRVGAHEALRAIYPAVRTRTWKTVPPVLRNVRIDHRRDHFRVTFEARHVDDETGIDFRWRGELTGEPDGTVTYRLDGRAKSAFETNRTGLCVLHPSLECAGRRLSVEHVDGRITKGSFPDTVSPHQPFFDIRTLEHRVAAGLRAKVTMEGETFEMEDQRNWTDASFKTYGGALANGLPLSFAAGHRVQQTVRFELLGRVPASVRRGPRIKLELPAASTAALPNLGTRWAPEAGPLGAENLQTLRGLGLGHLLLDVDVTSDGWRDVLARALTDGHVLKAKTWLRLTMTPNHQPAVAELARAFAGSADRLLAVSVSSRVEPCPGSVTVGLVRSIFERQFADAIPGTRKHAGRFVRLPLASAPHNDFADLNRFRAPADGWCAVPMCPQVHTFDHESIMENLQSQGSVLATVRSFNAHPILVGPVTMGRRRQPDARQGSLFCAAWTAGSLAHLLPTGLAHAIAYHEHAGSMGILGTPTEDVFAGFARAVGCAAVRSNTPGKVAALAVFDTDRARRLLVANLTRENIEVSMPAVDADLHLGPYATAWLQV